MINSQDIKIGEAAVGGVCRQLCHGTRGKRIREGVGVEINNG